MLAANIKPNGDGYKHSTKHQYAFLSATICQQDKTQWRVGPDALSWQNPMRRLGDHSQVSLPSNMNLFLSENAQLSDGAVVGATTSFGLRVIDGNILAFEDFMDPSYGTFIFSVKKLLRELFSCRIIEKDLIIRFERLTVSQILDISDVFYF